MEKNELVEYSKDLATSFNEFSSYELDVLVTLAYAARKQVKDHRNVDITSNVLLELDPKIIKKMVQGNVSTSRIEETLLSIFNTSIKIKKDDWEERRHIFEALKYNKDRSRIIFELKKEYIPLFFNLSSNFTQHELLEFTGLKSRHTKRLYQIVMSYKNLKKWEFIPEDFVKILNTKYRWVDIDTKIIKKASKELAEKTNIKNLEMVRERQGNTITKIILKWDIQQPEIIKEEKLDKKEIKKGVKKVEYIEQKSDENSLSYEELKMIEKIFEVTGIPFPDYQTKDDIPKLRAYIFLYQDKIKGV